MDSSALRFAIVGGLGTVVNSGYLFLFKEYLGLSLLASSILAIGIAIVFNYVLNDTFTFAGGGSFTRFALTCFVGVIINISILMLLSSFGIYYLIANILGILCAFTFNYSISKRFVWRETV